MDAHFEGHSAHGKTEWLTPPNLLKKLGDFDLDPCAPINRPWDIAKKHYTEESNGLIKPWFGRVFCNPPYDARNLKAFINKCIQHKNAIALVFARVDTVYFQDVIFQKAHSILFIKGRLKFYNIDGTEGGTAGAPSCLISFNEENTVVLKNCGIEGKLILL